MRIRRIKMVFVAMMFPVLAFANEPAAGPMILEKGPLEGSGLSSALLRPELLAAFVVAYQDYVDQVKKEKGREAGPGDLIDDNDVIGLGIDDREAAVVFYGTGPGFGGGIAYSVDLKTMKVIERRGMR